MAAPIVNTNLRFPYPTLIDGVFSDRLRLIAEGFRIPLGSVGRASKDDDAVPLDQVIQIVADAIAALPPSGPTAPIEIGWGDVFQAVYDQTLVNGQTYVVRDCPITDLSGFLFKEIYFTAFKSYQTHPNPSVPDPSCIILPASSVIIRHEGFTDAMTYGEVNWNLNSGGTINPEITRYVDYFGNDISGSASIGAFPFNVAWCTNNYCDKSSTWLFDSNTAMTDCRNNRVENNSEFNFGGAAFSVVSGNYVSGSATLFGQDNSAGDEVTNNYVTQNGQLDVSLSLMHVHSNRIEGMIVAIVESSEVTNCEYSDPNMVNRVVVETGSTGRICTAHSSNFEEGIDMNTAFSSGTITIPDSVAHAGELVLMNVAAGTTVDNIQFLGSNIARRPIRFRIIPGSSQNVTWNLIKEADAVFGSLHGPKAPIALVTSPLSVYGDFIEFQFMPDAGPGIWIMTQLYQSG